MHRFLDCTADEIEAVLKHKGTKGLELMTGMVIANGIKKGDIAAMQWVLEYLIGKAPAFKSEDPAKKRQSLTEDELDAQIAKLLPKEP